MAEPTDTHRLRTLVRAVLPEGARDWVYEKRRRLRCRPPVGWVSFGGLRRLTPVSRVFGFDRGTPIDLGYIGGFLAANCADIQGRVLEIADASYTRQYGGDRVTKSDVLHAVPGNPDATMVADLTCADSIPADTFDCIILTETLQCIYDVRAAVRHLHRILKPGGVLLATAPGISQISRYDMDRWGDCWRFTTLSMRRLFEEVFPPEAVTVESHGNVLTAIAFLHGLSLDELRQRELDHNDPDYQMCITVRAVKPR